MEFKHPKYYAELRALRKKHQASSIKQEATKKLCKRNRSFLLRKEECTAGKLRNRRLKETSSGLSSSKRQASSGLKLQAASFKPQAASVKLQATSYKLHDSWTTEHLITIHGSGTKGPDQDISVVRMLHMPCNLVWWKSDFSTLRYFQFNCEKPARIIIAQ